MPDIVERSDIQGLVASGYDQLNYACFLFLEILELPKAQDWLSRMVGGITTAVYPDDKLKPCFNLALSWQGIKKLGVPDDLIRNFPHEFVEGMERPEAAQILGDTGDSSEEKWEYGGSKTSGTKALHILALLYAGTEEELQALFQQTCSVDALNGGLRVVVTERSVRKDTNEPFGFRDGISQPPVSGLLGRSKIPVEPEIKTGEFVLGYENELGVIALIPSVDKAVDPDGHLADHPTEPETLKALGLNGTYLVFRKLSQKVDAFWKYVNQQASDANGAIDPEQAELIAAKMIGRSRDGSPLVLGPGADRNAGFLYRTTDPEGLKCPIGAHIRRANPRDSLLMRPSRSLRISRFHRLIRRGRKYINCADGSTAGDQGIYFIALNANLRRQFEFIQQTWLNDPTFNGLDQDKDPIGGDNTGAGEFTIQGQPVSRHLTGLPRFVTVRGGGYFFLPGIRALKFFSSYTAKPETEARPVLYSLRQEPANPPDR